MRLRRTFLLLVVAALLATAPASAQAASVGFDADIGAGTGKKYLKFKASKGERNRVRVELAKKAITIVDRGARRLQAKRYSGFPSCRQSGAQRVVCPFYELDIRLGDGNDSLSFSPNAGGSEKPVTDPLRLVDEVEDSEGALEGFALVNAGTGDDRIVGSKFDDTIELGPGRNQAFGPWRASSASSEAEKPTRCSAPHGPKPYTARRAPTVSTAAAATTCSWAKRPSRRSPPPTS